MPPLWSATIESHREAVREATLDATATLVAEQGLRAVTMSQIAQRTGIGRATLYKYFSDVDAILRAWHERQVAQHLDQIAALREGPGEIAERLRAVLEAYAQIQLETRKHGGDELAAALHHGEHVHQARAALRDFLGDLLAEAARAGVVRDDVPTEELALYCIQALSAAGDVRSKAALRRLVAVTLSGLERATD